MVWMVPFNVKFNHRRLEKICKIILFLNFKINNTMSKLNNFFSIRRLSLVFVLIFTGYICEAQNKSVLKVGETLIPSQKLTSPDSKFEFLPGLQLWEKSKLWEYQMDQTSGTRGNLKLDEKGSLVLYNTEGKAIWSSASDYPNVSELRLQNDGNLVIYDTNNEQIWALKDPKTGNYGMGSNGFFIKYQGTGPDPSRYSNQTVNLDDFDKKN